ncbi:saccharopine dehydrogenase family protein [Kitasatospora sp. NPDC018619]|uniref:saccharopine dehydrogenase family protein n=1 Tax=unclassified Kitasatospora TaxID=2633591 RepID=UPI0037A9C887
MTSRIVLLGATGYTGGLVLPALVRQGARPLLAGRTAAPLAALAERFGGLDHAVVDAADPAGLRALLRPGDVLVTTVGPFERFGHPVAEAAAEAGAHYLDSTGEVGFVRALHDRLHDRARAAGSVMLPAFGYDYVPGILAGALAAERAGEGARSLDIGYFATGSLRRGLSRGTRTTMRDGLTLPSARWRRRRLVDERTASVVRPFTVRGRRRNAFLVSGTEVLFLPEAFPELDEVTVYNGWFPALSRPISAVSAVADALTRHPAGRRLLGALERPLGGPPGPDAAERARTRTHVVAVASGGAGPLAEVHLEGPGIYDLTAELMAWGARRLADHPARSAGVLGPLDAFGLDVLREGCAGVGLAPL